MHPENLEAALATFSSGGRVIVTDEKNRESEAAIIMAAWRCSVAEERVCAVEMEAERELQ